MSRRHYVKCHYIIKGGRKKQSQYPSVTSFSFFEVQTKHIQLLCLFLFQMPALSLTFATPPC